jgi:hypothetical protein
VELLERIISTRPRFHASETEVQRGFEPGESLFQYSEAIIAQGRDVTIVPLRQTSGTSKSGPRASRRNEGRRQLRFRFRRPSMSASAAAFPKSSYGRPLSGSPSESVRSPRHNAASFRKAVSNSKLYFSVKNRQHGLETSCSSEGCQICWLNESESFHIVFCCRSRLDGPRRGK